jgi:hypothetical protein
VAEKHPYISAQGSLVAAIRQFRESMPAKINASNLKKLGIAPNNESFLINILRFIGLIGAEDAPSAKARAVFNKNVDGEFADGFAEMIKTSYKDLFDLRKDKAWTLSEADLITFFRNADQTSRLVGRRQAQTFQTLSSLSGHQVEAPQIRPTKKSNGTSSQKMKRRKEVTRAPALNAPTAESTGAPATTKREMALTVRIEVNLPAGGDQDTYDRIFKSIRSNLLNGE